jgi:glycosyltransferase involved in cell wall biosynthesis
MNHLIISREYPPAPYTGGGIGTYVDHISRLLAQRGETVHVIGQLCPAAQNPLAVDVDGRLTVHRVPLDHPLELPSVDRPIHQAILDRFRDSVLPCQAFVWQAALLAEWLIEHNGIDLVEAQEYEAPLYFLMLRRTLGVAAARRVPLVVHLHSPTEFIFKDNECENRPDYGPLTRLEEYTIQGADAVLCPSHFLARAAERRYGLRANSVEVIPLPMGDVAALARPDGVWRTGSICFVGRLEPRKGVHEWIEAASSVATDDSSLQFCLVGADSNEERVGNRSVRRMLRAEIPSTLRSRFTFVGAVRRDRLSRYRAAARIGVIPSRWENFPYSCIEAMASGLPVIVTPNGGMTEMVKDGQTGWIADGADARSLAVALRRAAATPPKVLAEMGSAASTSIRALCADAKVVQQHLVWRQSIVSAERRRLPERSVSSAVPQRNDDVIQELLRRAEATVGASCPGFHGDRTMTPLDLLRSTRRQQMALVRRAFANPGYVINWLKWHFHRTVRRLSPPARMR